MPVKKNKKKKKNKRKNEDLSKDSVEEEVADQNPEKKLTKRELQEALFNRPRRRKQDKEEFHDSHEFWGSQPVPKMNEEITETGPIETKTLDEVRDQPYQLASSFEWYSLDLQDSKDLDDLYKLLSDHYVEDDDNMFRFNYSRPFLKWALCPPGYLVDYHLAVRVKSNKKLVACITAIPAKIRVHDDIVRMVEINFLCVHKKLRSKRLAPVLIKEITRRVNLQDTWQAAYTAGVVIPKPVAKNQYWHRSFDPKKLVEIGFSSVPRNSTMPRMIHLSRVPDEMTLKMRPMRAEDAGQVCKILSDYLAGFKYAPIFNEEEILHWFLPREDVIQAFVKEDANGQLTDMFSYYCLSSHVIKHEKHNMLNAVYSYYNVANTSSWTELMQNSLICACKIDNKDVFNCLNVMDNEKFLSDLKFGPGDGYLHYYLFNWKCPTMDTSDVGLVLM